MRLRLPVRPQIPCPPGGMSGKRARARCDPPPSPTSPGKRIFPASGGMSGAARSARGRAVIRTAVSDPKEKTETNTRASIPDALRPRPPPPRPRAGRGRRQGCLRLRLGRRRDPPRILRPPHRRRRVLQGGHQRVPHMVHRLRRFSRPVRSGVVHGTVRGARDSGRSSHPPDDVCRGHLRPRPGHRHG